MSTANTLRNMSLVWAMLQEGFESGELEFEHVDSIFTIDSKKYIIEAKSQCYFDNVKYGATLKSNDISAGYAQLKFRSKYSLNGIIAINRAFSHGNPKESAQEYKPFPINADGIREMKKAGGYVAKSTTLGVTDEDDLTELSVLRIPGEDAEAVRRGLSSYAIKKLEQRGFQFNSELVLSLVNSMDTILETISEHKENGVDIAAVKQWFLFRSENEGVYSLPFNDDASKLFNDEEEFKRSKQEWNDSKNLRGTINPDFVLTATSPEELLENIGEVPELDSDSRINHIKIAYLLKES